MIEQGRVSTRGIKGRGEEGVTRVLAASYLFTDWANAIPNMVIEALIDIRLSEHDTAANFSCVWLCLIRDSPRVIKRVTYSGIVWSYLMENRFDLTFLDWGDSSHQRRGNRAEQKIRASWFGLRDGELTMRDTCKITLVLIIEAPPLFSPTNRCSHFDSESFPAPSRREWDEREAKFTGTCGNPIFPATFRKTPRFI